MFLFSLFFSSVVLEVQIKPVVYLFQLLFLIGVQVQRIGQRFTIPWSVAAASANSDAGCAVLLGGMRRGAAAVCEAPATLRRYRNKRGTRRTVPANAVVGVLKQRAIHLNIVYTLQRKWCLILILKADLTCGSITYR